MISLQRVFSLILLCTISFHSPIFAQQKIRIACIGNSITAGSRLEHPDKEAYPAQLQQMLGDGYVVMNFGVSAKTVIHTGDAYTATKKYKEALQSNPDIVFIKLGTNDSRLPYRLDIEQQFETDYKNLIHAFNTVSSKPRIILLLPVASYLADTTRQTDAAITQFVLPHIRQVAFDEKLELIDLHSITLSKSDLFPDSLHPSVAGAQLIAKRLYEVVMLKTDHNFDIFKKIQQPYKVSSFYGYDCADFTFNNREAKIVKPRVAAAGHPWIWRARFWGHEPQTDIALLDRGFHLVYCDASELFGNKEAVELWNAFYDFVHQAGLSKKAAMEGMSRGGVYVYNWAAVNSGKVACVYADAPVLDLRSWPGGKGKGPGSSADWEIFKKDYGYTTEEATKDFKNNPLDKIDEIVKGQYPMLHVVGDADEVVPVEENTAIFEKNILAAGGDIKVIHKPGVGHHPHSLANPQPIVDFILAATKNAIK
ncbi:MAG: GDSL-type esterase/lipase family protein [Agriterribacter sp.]